MEKIFRNIVNSGWDIPAVSQSDLKLNISDIVIRL